MDIKKLMHILLHDIKEMELFVEELKQPVAFDRMDRELLLTKIAGIRHLLEVAEGIQEPHADIFPPGERKQQEKESTAGKVDRTPAAPRRESGFKAEIPAPEEKKTSPIVPGFDERQVIPGVKPVQNAEFPLQEVPEPEEKPESHPEKQILGEKFVAGKSVNDLLLEKSKTDSRFSNLPVSNLANAVTTNDKFLFIRELFDGNADHYNETIRKLP
jgi:hypothetical protein